VKIWVIGDRDTTTGFRLAGVDEARHVDFPDEARSALREAAGDDSIGLVLITEYWAEMIRSDIEQIMREQTLPVILGIPDRGGRKQTRSVGEIIRKRIGIGF